MRTGLGVPFLWLSVALLCWPTVAVAGEKDEPKKEEPRKEDTKKGEPGKEGPKPNKKDDEDDVDDFLIRKPPKPKTDDPTKKDPENKNEPVKPAVQEACKKCQGRGLSLCPTHSKQALVMRVSDKPPDCCGGAGFTVCPDCKGAQQRYDRIAESLKGRQTHLENVQKRIGQQFTLYQTPHACFFMQLSDDHSMQLVTMCETLALHINKYFKDGALDATSPPECRIFIMSTTRNYEGFHEALMRGARAQGRAQEGEGEKDLYKKTSGSHAMNFGILNKERVGDANIVQGGVNIFAHIIVKTATNNKTPPWMDEGFAAWCEFLMFQNCHFYTIAYEDNRIDMRGSWSESIRKGLAARTTIGIPDLMEIELRGLKPLTYQQCWSFTTYLIARGAKYFEKVVAELKAGGQQIGTVEKTYGQKARDMTSSWARWAAQQP